MQLCGLVMAARHSTSQKASGELVTLKLQMTELNKPTGVTEAGQSLSCTKASSSVAFERPAVIVARFLKPRAICRIQWVITYLVWNKLLQVKNKELDPAPSDVSRKTSLTTWFHSVEMLFHKQGLTSPFHVWFSEDSWVWNYNMSLVYYKCSPQCIY